MPLTDEERKKQIAEWDAEAEQAKKDKARYEELGDKANADAMVKRIETIRKLRAELLV